MSIPTKRLRLSIVLLLLLTMASARHLPPSRTAPTHLHHPPPTAPTATSYRHHPSPPPSPLSIRPPSPPPSPLSSQLSIPPPPSPPIFIRIPVPSSYANYFESITAFAAFLVAVALLVVFLLMRQSCCPRLPVGPKSIITTICTVFCVAMAGPATAADAQVILDAAATGPSLVAVATRPSPAATSPTGPSHAATTPPKTPAVHPTTGSPLSAQVATPPPVFHFPTEGPPPMLPLLTPVAAPRAPFHFPTAASQPELSVTPASSSVSPPEPASLVYQIGQRHDTARHDKKRNGMTRHDEVNGHGT